VHDILGKEILCDIDRTKEELRLNLRSFEKGIYFVEISYNGGKTIKKVVVD
jgi:hypothetical protein